MNKYIIAVKKLDGLYVKPRDEKSQSLAYTMNADMVQLGYVMSQDLFNVVATLSKKELQKVHTSVIKALRMIVGANVAYNPMYPNFPKQVMEASDEELFMNAMNHYWSSYVLGEENAWLPQYTKLERPFFPESVNIKVLDLVSEKDFNGVFTKIMSSNDSISGEDKEIVEHFLRTPELKVVMPATIPYKENLCMVLADSLGRYEDITPFVTNSTDILRVATYMSGGDVSLGTNTKFTTIDRPRRKLLVKALESVINAEDISRHSSKWNKLFHRLHTAEYSDKVTKIANNHRNNVTVRTFNGKVDAAIDSKNLTETLRLLSQRPSEFARRLDHILRTFGEDKAIYTAFGHVGVADEIPTRILFQLLGHFKNRDIEKEKRVVFPKGSVQKAVLLAEIIPGLKPQTVQSFDGIIHTVLRDRFEQLDDLGKVYIDPELRNAPLPTAQRSASTAKETVARGTRMDFGDDDKNVLRFFVYWKGRDIDLSATFHNEDYHMTSHVSYTRLRDGAMAVHSGDITSAPNGASEFIDIDIEAALKKGHRYVAMNVLVYSGENFKDHDICYAGWMTREKAGSNEIYDPKTVEQKIDLTADSRNTVPVMFDLLERKAVWIDLMSKRHQNWGGNNVESNRASIEQTIEAIVTLSETRATLYDLFEAHALARGEIVEDREDAEVVYGLFDGDVKATDITEINAEYMAG